MKRVRITFLRWYCKRFPRVTRVYPPYCSMPNDGRRHCRDGRLLQGLLHQHRGRRSQKFLLQLTARHHISSLDRLPIPQVEFANLAHMGALHCMPAPVMFCYYSEFQVKKTFLVALLLIVMRHHLQRDLLVTLLHSLTKLVLTMQRSCSTLKLTLQVH